MSDSAELQALREENRALKAHLASRAQSALWDNLPEGLLILDAEARIVSVNEAAARLLGQTQPQLLGHRVHIGWPFYTEDGEPLREAEREELLAQALAAPRADLVLGIDPPGHGRVWVQVSVAAMRDGRGRPDGAICILRDITVQRAATEALRASEARFRGLFETIGECVIFLDHNFQVALANLAAERLLGRSRHEMVGYRLTELGITYVGPEGALLSEGALESMMRRGLVRPYHELLVGIRRDDADIVWGKVRTTPMRALDGGIQGVVVAFADVTQRVLAEQALRSQRDALEVAVAQRTEALQEANAQLQAEIDERRRAEAALADERAVLRRVLDTNPNLIFAKDRRSRFVLVNRAMAAAYGLTPEQMEGLDEWELAQMTGAPLDAVPRFLAEDQRVIVGQQPQRFAAVMTDYPNLTAVIEMVKVPLTLRGDPGYTLCVGVDVTTRVQAERALQESESFLRQVLDTVPSAVFVKDREGRHVLLNQAYADAYGLPKEAMIGKTECELAVMSGIMGVDDVEVFLAQDRQVLATGQPFFLDEEALRLADGTTRWVQVVKLPLTFRGQSDYMLGITHDITDRKDVVEALRQSESFMRQVIDADPNLVFVKDGAGRYEMVNRTFAALFDLTPEQCVGMRLEDLMGYVDQPDPLLQGLNDADTAVLEAGQPVELGQAPVRLHGAGQRWFHVLKAPLVLDDGLPRVLGVAQDVTERVAAEQALRQSEARYRSLFESASDAILLETLDGRVVDCNPQACQVYGLTPDALLGTKVEALVTPGLTSTGDELLATLLAGDQVTLESMNRRADGSLFPAEVRARLVEIEGQRLVLVHVRDLTERHRLEEQLRQAIKMEAIGRLAGGVAHDFNNLLTVINGYGELVLGLMPEGDPLREDVGQILSAGQRAAELTRRLLAFSRRQVLELRACDINEVIEGLARILRRIIGEDVSLDLDLAPDLGQVRADGSQIEQVLVNLAVNARDAMPFGGTLTLRTANVTLAEPLNASHLPAPAGDYVLISVRDTGEGMSPQVLAHLFEPFYTTKEVGKGTGLGLAMIYGIIKQLGGGVDVASAAGEGSRFDLYLPRYSAAQDASEVAAPLVALPRGHETVLLVEDQSLVSGLAARFLEQLGYRVLAVSSASEAIAKLRESAETVHLVLSDVIMPEMSGPEMVQYLRQQGLAPQVLYMSGYAQDTIEARGQRLDAPLMAKPFTLEELALAVRQALDGAGD
jgi:PAS domain S-box-containing protein